MSEQESTVAVTRRPGGFLPGSGGRPKGALSRFTKAMREEGAEQIRQMEANGTPANPIKAMLHVLKTAKCQIVN